MITKVRISGLTLLTILLASCSLPGISNESTAQEDEFPEEISQAYTAELFSQGFEFCSESYLEVEIEQSHEIAQFNFSNYVNAVGQLPLKAFGLNEKSGLETKSDIELTGEGWAGICQFKSSGSISFQLLARLIPGEGNNPHLLIHGQCESALTTKPPCGDFGMMPLEKAVHLVIPYQDGETTEWEWENRVVGVYGSSKWTIHIPCDN